MYDLRLTESCEQGINQILLGVSSRLEDFSVPRDPFRRGQDAGGSRLKRRKVRSGYPMAIIINIYIILYIIYIIIILIQINLCIYICIILIITIVIYIYIYYTHTYIYI